MKLCVHVYLNFKRTQNFISVCTHFDYVDPNVYWFRLLSQSGVFINTCVYTYTLFLLHIYVFT